MGIARVHWRGAEIREKLRAASELAVDRTMGECVHHAKADHPAYPPASEPGERFANRTDFTDQSIYVMDPAHTDGDTVKGRWGSDAEHALYLEIGTSREGPTAEERALAADGNLNDVTPPIGPLMAPRPFLRPAADMEYPVLRARVAAGFRGAQLP